MTVKKALLFNKETHRRLPLLQGGMWAVQLIAQTNLAGVAIVGRPTAQKLDNGLRLQVLRCAVVEGTKNGCSKLYGACAKIGRIMGSSDMLTYIHDDESGVSLIAAGWVEDIGFHSVGGEWDRPSRPRTKTVEPGAKRRFFTPWSDFVLLHPTRFKRNITVGELF